MSENATASSSSLPAPENQTTSSITASDSSQAELIRVRAETCQKLADDVVHGRLQPTIFVSRLREAGATLNEVTDYINQVEDHQCRQQERDTEQLPHSDSRASDNHNNEQATPAINAADEVAWALLQERLLSMDKQKEDSGTRSLDLEALGSLYGLAKPKTIGIPSSVLAAVVIGTGNPRVFQGYLYPYPQNPYPLQRVRVLTG